MNTSWIRSWSFAIAALTVLSAASFVPAVLRACPFCSAVSMTLGEELKASDVAVIATLVERPAAADPAAGGTPEKSKFKITKVLKGEKLLANKPTIDMLYFGTQEPGATFLIFGVDPKEPAWGTPNELSAEGLKYIEKIAELSERPPSGWPSSRNISRIPINSSRETPSTNSPGCRMRTWCNSKRRCTATN